MGDKESLQHYGILGMKWGRRKGATVGDLSKLARKNEKLKSKLSSTIRKSEKNKLKIAKYTKRLEKHGGYITSIGEDLAERNGKKLARKLHKNKKLDKRMAKIQQKINGNQELMKTKFKDIPKEDVKIDKRIVDSMLND